MADYKEYSGKTVDDAITQACLDLEISSDRLEYEVLNKESGGFLGFFSKSAVIKAREKDENSVSEAEVSDNDTAAKSEDNKDVKVNAVKAEADMAEKADHDEPDEKHEDENLVTLSDQQRTEMALDFFKKVFDAMGTEVKADIKIDPEDNTMNIDLSGNEMGILIGKRGGTLDSLQYLVSLVINKHADNYMKVKLDTENYRERRKATLENFAHNLASKVKRTHKPVFLEPMNPYERRIIHYALQDDKFVETHSEGDEPYRKVVITLKPGVKTDNYRRNSYNRRGGRYNGGYRRSGRGGRHYDSEDHESDYYQKDGQSETPESSNDSPDEN
jgi:spoIIIJ-associated protein